MSQVIVRYKVKKDKANENIEYIKKIFSTLESTKPDGLRYASFKLEDGLSFVHIAFIETSDGSNPLQALDEFQAFVGGIADRCDEPPIATAIETIGNYRIF